MENVTYDFFAFNLNLYLVRMTSLAMELGRRYRLDGSLNKLGLSYERKRRMFAFFCGGPFSKAIVLNRETLEVRNILF